MKLRINPVIAFALICMCAAAALIALYCAEGLGSQDNSYLPGAQPSAQTTRHIYLYEPDYSVDISQDAEYLDKNRYIQFKLGAETFTITDGNYKAYGSAAELFGDYFDALMAGDSAALRELYSASALEKLSVPEKFTMQRIYDINVEKLSELLIEDEGEHYGEVRIECIVSYKIMRNDGTFRSDVGSDSSLPEYFLLYRSGEHTYISEVIGYYSR